MKLLVLAFLSVLSYASVLAQTNLTTRQIALLDSIATQDVPENAPGIATAIIQDGKVIYEKYAGLADLTDGTDIRSSTRFNIASNGKQFTALAILELVDNEKIKLSDDIRKWFPNLFPDVKEEITVLSLLNHTSGIRDCYDLWSLQGYTWWKQSFDNKDVLTLIEKQNSLNFLPNSSYLYSNTNYILLALLIEKATTKTFVEYTNGMFQKLNMPNTSFECDHTKIRGHIARAYFNFDTWTIMDWIWNVCGDGNIFSTLEDQIQWEKLVQGKGNTSFKPEIILLSQQFIEGSQLKNYGYGLEFGKYKAINYAFHEGATGAWKATVTRFPSKKTSFVTLTNTGKSIPSMQTRQMADVLFELQENTKYFETAPSSVGDFVGDDEIIGTYLTENDFSFRFEKRDGKFFLIRSGRNDVELAREADNVFHQKYDPAFKQEFAKNTKGEMQVTAYYVNHAPYTLTKAIAIEKDFDYEGPTGDYFNSETNTTLNIRHLDGTNYEVSFRNDYKTTGLLVSSSKMLVDFYSFAFKEGHLFLDGGRIKMVKYERK